MNFAMTIKRAFDIVDIFAGTPLASWDCPSFQAQDRMRLKHYQSNLDIVNNKIFLVDNEMVYTRTLAHFDSSEPLNL
jgi:hypothetical protein